MLNIMRKNASSLLIKILFGIIVVVMAFFGINTYQQSKGNRVALVNGEPISYESYRNTYDNYIDNLRSQYGSNLTQDVLEMFQVPRTVINSLVNRALLIQAAENIKIRVTDAELAGVIQSISAFQSGGTFNNEQYQYVLQSNDLTPETFETDQRESLLINELYAYVTSGIKVTEGEILDWYEWINTTVDLDYVLFDPYSINDIEPTEEELGSYFEAYEENYRTEPRVKVQYLVFRSEDYTDQVEIDDADIQEYYDMNPSEFETEKTVEARHILITVDEDATPEVVEEKRQKAEEIYEMARSGRDFAELAKEYSEGTTRETGGLLGEFKKGDMVEPFSEAAFSMAEGEISEPVRTQFGWHIIKVEKVHEATVEPLEEVSDQIRDKLVKEDSQEIAYEMADAAFDQALSDDDFERTAADLGMQLQTTDYFTQNGPATGISDPASFGQAAFEAPGTEISDVLNIGGDYYILQKTGEMASKIPELADVKDRVRSDLILQMQDDQARQKAEEFLEAMKTAGSMESACRASGLEMENSGAFKRSGAIPGIGYESEIIQAAFLLSDDNKIADQVFKGSGGYYVVQLNERQAPTTDELDTQRESIKSKMISQKQQIVFDSWLEKLRTESEIIVEEGYLK